MKKLLTTSLLIFSITSVSCGALPLGTSNSNNVANLNNSSAATSNTVTQPVSETTNSSVASDSAATAPNEPKNVREFFLALPDKYFTLEGCDRAKDKGCKRAKADYLKRYLDLEDLANGYLKCSCDGAQSCLEMAIFKKPDGSYIVGLRSDGELSSESYFIDYASGAWTDVGKKIVPGYDRSQFYYEFPRRGTIVTVYEKEGIDGESEAKIGDRGTMLYELAWKNGKFLKQVVK